MTLTNPQKTILHVAKAKTNLSDAGYRSALAQIAGVTSSTELDRAGFEAMMGYFDYLGFRPKEAKGASYGERLGMASWAQIELIRTLWTEITLGAYEGRSRVEHVAVALFQGVVLVVPAKGRRPQGDHGPEGLEDAPQGRVTATGTRRRGRGRMVPPFSIADSIGGP